MHDAVPEKFACFSLTALFGPHHRQIIRKFHEFRGAILFAPTTVALRFRHALDRHQTRLAALSLLSD
jgi:hypothetical protein